MKKLFPETPDVPQGTANRGVRIIERHLRMHKVERAKDLPEEAKVRLLRDLQTFFDSERHGGDGSQQGGPKKGLWSRLWERVENYLSFSETRGNSAGIICTLSGGCVAMPGTGS